MDDMLKSFPAVKMAVDIIHKVKVLCKQGGFNLTTFSSKYVGVLRSIPNENRKDGIKDKDLNLGTLTEGNALGIKWNIQEDTLDTDRY